MLITSKYTACLLCNWAASFQNLQFYWNTDLDLQNVFIYFLHFWIQRYSYFSPIHIIYRCKFFFFYSLLFRDASTSFVISRLGSLGVYQKAVYFYCCVVKVSFVMFTDFSFMIYEFWWIMVKWIVVMKIQPSIFALMTEEKHKKTPVRLVCTGIRTRDLPNVSLVHYHGATSLGSFSFVNSIIS